MSLILDALNKADDERKQNQEETPGIDAVHGALYFKAENNRIRRRWVVAIAVGIFTLLISVYFLGRSSSDAPQKAQQTKTQLPDLPRPAPTPKKVETEKEKIIAAQYAKASSEKAKELKKVQATTDKPLTKSQKDIGNLYATAGVEEIEKEQKQQVAPAQAKPKKQKPKPVRSEPKTVSPNSIEARYPKVGYVRELSYGTQQKVPTLMYTAHYFDADGQSYVVINGKKLWKGDQATPEVVLIDILSDGVILRFEGDEFKMDAYSSWVNM